MVTIPRSTRRLWLAVIALLLVLAGRVWAQAPGLTSVPLAELEASRLEFWRYLATQSGLLLLVVGLIAYIIKEARRLSKKNNDEFEGLLERNNAALTASAVATSRQTDATHRLAKICENLEGMVEDVLFKSFEERQRPRPYKPPRGNTPDQG